MIAIANQINTHQYAELLAHTLPKAIETEAENERAGHRESVDDERRKDADAGRAGITTNAVLLIEGFEKKAYPVPSAEPYDVLKTLLGNRGLQQVDLLPIFGARATCQRR